VRAVARAGRASSRDVPLNGSASGRHALGILGKRTFTQLKYWRGWRGCAPKARCNLRR